MEKRGQQVTEKGDGLDLNIGNDPSRELWNNHDDAIDDLMRDEDYTYTDPDDDDYVPGRKRSKRSKRHTPQQIQELMAAYDQCTHPDHETRRALGRKIGLTPGQVKFWFQNRRSNMQKEAHLEQNLVIQQENASLLAENQSLRQAMLTQSCITCGGGMLPSNPALEKQRLLIQNAELKDEYLRASAIHSMIIRTSSFTQPGWIISSRADREALRCHAEKSMEQFLMLATDGEPMWLPTSNGEMLNYVEYGARNFPCLFGLRPNGFVVEATRDTAMVWGTAADLVGILMDTARWSEMFPGIVASVAAGDVVSTGIFASWDGQIQLMNSELWVQSPCVPNRIVNILRFSKLVAERKWAVMDVSIDSILGQEVIPARYMGCRLLPSGCLIEDTSNGCCKVTWIVHAEYDETYLPMMFKPLFLNGQALGARRWLTSLQRQCEYIAALLSSYDRGNNTTGILNLAHQMTVSFYAAVSGPVTPTQATSKISKWFGSMGTGVERFDAAVRMVTWKKPGSVAGEPDNLVLSATTTLWFPSVPPECVFDYLCNNQLRGEWDVLANGASVKVLGSVETGLAGNVVSVVCSNITDEILILQEACTDASGSLVVYAPIEEKTMHAVMVSRSNACVSLLPSGFAILPDGRQSKAREALVTAPSTSSAPVCRNNTGGSFLTMAYQVLLPSALPDNLTTGAFNEVGNLICQTIEKIKTAVKAEIVLPV